MKQIVSIFTNWNYFKNVCKGGRIFSFFNLFWTLIRVLISEYIHFFITQLLQLFLSQGSSSAHFNNLIEIWWMLFEYSFSPLWHRDILLAKINFNETILWKYDWFLFWIILLHFTYMSLSNFFFLLMTHTLI